MKELFNIFIYILDNSICIFTMNFVCFCLIFSLFRWVLKGFKL